MLIMILPSNFSSDFYLHISSKYPIVIIPGYYRDMHLYDSGWRKNDEGVIVL